jgi:hypothetical protein
VGVAVGVGDAGSDVDVVNMGDGGALPDRATTALEALSLAMLAQRACRAMTVLYMLTLTGLTGSVCLLVGRQGPLAPLGLRLPKIWIAIISMGIMAGV